MRATNSFRAMRRAILLLSPTGIRDAAHRAHLRRRHGLVFAGDSTSLQITGSRFGRHCRIAAPVYFGDSFLDDYSYLEPYCRVSSTSIGKFCSIAPYCVIGPLSHPLEHASTHPAFYLRAERYSYTFVDQSNDPYQETRTTIGNDVWIGSGAFIRRGVRVGDGSVIGAGAVVTKDVPPYSIVGGVPAKVIRMRFSDNTIQALMDLKWWDKDEKWLQEHGPLFGDVDRLIASQDSPGLL